MNGRAIIVDDELLLLKTAKRFFSKHRIPCETFAQWQSDLASSLTEQDILFLDLKMPGKDGLDVINELADSKTRVNLVLLTGEDETILETAKMIAQKQGLNVVGSLAKPFEFNRLLEFLAKSPTKESGGSSKNFESKTLSEGQCREAIKKEYIYPVFQPQVNVLDHSLDGVECLARLSIPEIGDISPAVFVPFFERYQLIDEMTFLLLKSGLKELVTQLPNKGKTKVSFNLSAISINKEFTDTLICIVNNSGMMPENITFEITETAAIELSIECQIALSKLRLKGFGLALDDFGTGFSTIKQLNELPFNEIKIDRSFVADLQTKNTSQAIVSSTAKLAQSLGYRLVVEGVETREQLKYLLQQHSHIVQGYLYSKPIPIHELINFVNNPQSTTTQGESLDEHSMELLRSINPVFLKPNTDKHYDFEHVLKDYLGFKVTTFSDAHQYIGEAKAIVLFNATTQQLQEIKITNSGSSLYFLLADDVQTNELLAFIEQGYSDVFPTFIYPEALCNKILTSFVALNNSHANSVTTNKVQSIQEESFHTKTLQFCLALAEQHSIEYFTHAVFDFFTETGMETALCLRWGKKKQVYRAGDKCSIPLLERLFDNLATMGAVAEFSSRAIFNGQFCSLLLLNLPEDVKAKDQIIEQCQILMNLLDMKAEAILYSAYWSELKLDINSLENEFSTLVNKQHDNWSRTLRNLDDVVKESAKFFHLNDAETTLLTHNIERTLADSNAQSALIKLMLSLRDIALQIDNTNAQSGISRKINKG